MINPTVKKTLLILTSTFPRWRGDTTPLFVFELAKKMEEYFKVIVVAPHAKGSKQAEVMEGLEVIRFRYFFDLGESLAYQSGIIANLKKNPLNIFLIPLFFMSQIIAIIKVINNKEIDVIHAHWLIPQGFAAVIARWFAKRKPLLVCTMHGSDLKLPAIISTPIYKTVFHFSDALIAVSHSLKQQAINKGAVAQKIEVIPMGIDIGSRFIVNEQATKKQNNLLFVGRLIKNKGVDILLHALTDVVSIFPETQLVIVGDGPERQALQLLAQQLKLTNHVTFAGAKQHQELPLFYQTASIFISPTRVEGFGLTLAEALACGCAVVVSDLPEVSDIVIHQQTGLTFTVGDKHALADNIIRLLKNPSLSKHLAEVGRDKVVRMVGWNVIISKYVSLFDMADTQRGG